MARIQPGSGRVRRVENINEELETKKTGDVQEPNWSTHGRLGEYENTRNIGTPSLNNGKLTSLL